MNIHVIAVGKTDSPALLSLIAEFEKRLNHYTNMDFEIISPRKGWNKLPIKRQMELEGEAILNVVKPNDTVVLLDEKGTEFTSLKLADYLQKKMNSGIKRLVLVIGGPFGFSELLQSKSEEQISLSKMTFSHQMVRLFLVEQLYRAFTILRNEPYHHE